MSNQHQPINGVQTRVILSEGDYYPQFSTDGLTWFPLECRQAKRGDCIEACENFQAWANCMVEIGEVAWRSKQ
jgi:hypothetical protein